MNSIASPFVTGDLGYKKTSQGFVFGISFTLRDGQRLMAPYALLSHVEMSDSEEAAIVYSFGVVRIKGRNVETIYDLTHRHELVAVWCGEAVDGDTENNQRAEIVFKKRDEDEEF